MKPIGMKTGVRIARTKAGTTVYLVDPRDETISVWHFNNVTDPLSPSDEAEITWACDRLGLDKRVTFKQIRDALRASR